MAEPTLPPPPGSADDPGGRWLPYAARSAAKLAAVAAVAAFAALAPPRLPDGFIRSVAEFVACAAFADLLFDAWRVHRRRVLRHLGSPPADA